MLILLSLGFLAMNLIGPRTRLSLLQQRVLQLCVLVSLLHFLWSITILQLNPHTMMGYDCHYGFRGKETSQTQSMQTAT